MLRITPATPSFSLSTTAVNCRPAVVCLHTVHESLEPLRTTSMLASSPPARQQHTTAVQPSTAATAQAAMRETMQATEAGDACRRRKVTPLQGHASHMRLTGTPKSVRLAVNMPPAQPQAGSEAQAVHQQWEVRLCTVYMMEQLLMGVAGGCALSAQSGENAAARCKVSKRSVSCPDPLAAYLHTATGQHCYLV